MRRICFVFALLVFVTDARASDHPLISAFLGNGYSAKQFTAPSRVALPTPSALLPAEIPNRSPFNLSLAPHNSPFKTNIVWSWRGLLFPLKKRTSSNQCYAMRTYTLEKVNPSSDETRVVGESTCLPASRLEFKEARPTLR